MLIEYTRDDRVAVITLNRPQADNAITTAMGARLTEILETIAVRPAVRAIRSEEQRREDVGLQPRSEDRQ